jgi:bacterioferritin-associated ferredoxin
MKNMYLCLCDDVTEDQIKKVISKGIKNPEDILVEMNVSTGCGSCRDTLLAFVEDCLQK